MPALRHRARVAAGLAGLLVLARIVETGLHGPKTSGAVVALAIRR